MRDMGHQMNSWMSRLSENSRNAVLYSNSVSGINNALNALGHGMYQQQQEYMGAFVPTMGDPRVRSICIFERHHHSHRLMDLYSFKLALVNWRT